MPSTTNYDLSACCCGRFCFECENAIPEDLVATLSGCMSDTVNLTWDGSLWSGTFTCGGFSLTLEFLCDSPGTAGTIRTVNADHPECEWSQGVTIIDSCDPFLVSNQPLTLTGCGCCSGTLYVTISE